MFVDVLGVPSPNPIPPIPEAAPLLLAIDGAYTEAVDALAPPPPLLLLPLPPPPLLPLCAALALSLMPSRCCLSRSLTVFCRANDASRLLLFRRDGP